MTRRDSLFLVLFAGLVARLPAADPTALTQSPFASPAPLPSLVAFAASHHIPLEGIAVAADSAVAHQGDQVVLLLTLEKAGAAPQWLVRVSHDDLTDQERKMKPWPEELMHTATGLDLRFANSPTALRVEFIGPFSAGLKEPPASRQARTLVSREYLELGIAHYCQSALQIMPRLQAAGLAEPAYYGGPSVLSAEAVAQGKKVAAAFGLTPAEERLAFSVFFALRTFFSAAMEIPACQDVLEQVIQKPSAWSVLSSLGVSTNFKYGWQEVRSAPDGPVALAQPVYLLPLRVSLNNTLAVKATLAVTVPHPPLQACAGIVALCAEHPTVPDRRLFLRVLSARRAAPAG